MSDSDTVELNLKPLEDFLRALGSDVPVAKVGILGDKDARTAKVQQNDRSFKTETTGSNAEIGLKHEYGLGVPLRSFIRMPLNNYLAKYLDNSNAFTKETLAQVIKEKSVKPWLEKVAITATVVIEEAFATGGFGQWEPSNMAHKTNHQTLVETGQLRRSISWEID